MHPILFRIGPLTIYTYGLAIAIAFLCAISLVFHEGKRAGINTSKLGDLCFIVILVGIIGSRILYILMNPSDYLLQPLKMFKIWEGGLVIYGGIIGAMVAGIVYIKKNALPFWQIMDIIAPALALAQSIGRIGCFMAGCCYGAPTDLPWGVKFSSPNSLAPIGECLHPTQLYHSLSNLVLFVILYYILKKKRAFTGQTFCLYLCLYPLFRFITEFFRGDSRVYLMDHINLTQGLSIVIFISGLYLYFWKRSLKDNQTK